MVKENGMVMMSEKEFIGMQRKFALEIESLAQRIEMLQKAVLQLTKENNQQDVKVSRRDFLDMYNIELIHMFELSEKDEKDFTKENQKIYEHDITVHWNGMYCNCGDGATPSNHIIPGIETCDEELDGEEW